MQKITITATSLNEALQEVKKRFGEDVAIERTEEINNQVRVTVALFEGEEPKKVPSLRKADKNRIDNEQTLIGFVLPHYKHNLFFIESTPSQNCINYYIFCTR